MLEYLLKSTTRKQILIYMYTNLYQIIHIRLLAREIKEHVYSVQREVQNLQTLGLIKVSKKFNKIVLELNKEHPYYCDMLSMVYKDFGLGYEIIKNRDKLNGLQLAFLGSFYITKKKLGKYDIDLLLVGNMSISSMNTFVQQLEQQLGYEILYSLITMEEFNQRKKQVDGFVSNILRNTYVLLVGDSYKIFA